MTLKQTPQFIGDQNRRLVLNKIRLHEPISRVALAQMTTLSKKTITLIVEQLVNDGLISNLGKSEALSGRHPQLLGLRPGARFAAGIVVEERYIEGMLIDLRGETYAHFKRKYNRSDGNSIYIQLEELFAEMKRHTPYSEDAYLGTGIGVTGVLFEEETVQTRLNHSIKGIRAAVERMTGKPVWIDNYVRLAIIAEQLRETSDPTANIIYLDIGEGAGGSAFINGFLYSGNRHTGMEIGHMKVVRDGEQCTCGSRGCLEAYINESALLGAYWNLKNKSGETQDTAQTITELMSRFDTEYEARSVLLKAAELIGLTISNLINLLAPDRIIIGGYFSQSPDQVLETILGVAKQNALHPLVERTDIVKARFGQSARAIGAAHLPLNQLFQFIK